MAVLDTVAHDRSISSVVPLVLGLAVAWWLLTLRPAIFIRGDQLVVRNAFWSRRLLRDEVTSVTPGYCGLVVRCREGRGCTAWAVQKSNWSTWNGRVRRADRVAAEIMRWARRD